MTPKLYDVLIIGGGPAGLSIATALARQVYTALVLDSGAYRNAVSRHMHTVPGWDHADPAAFRARARADLEQRYDSVEFRSATVATVRKLDSGVFEAVDEQGGVYRGRRLGLGTGVRDVLEEQPEGYAECWGRGIFHCMFCHGYEERGADSAGVLAGGFVQGPDMLAHVALMTKRLAQSITIYTNGDATLKSEVQTKLHSSKVHYDDRRITKFQLVDDGPAARITFADGGRATEGFVASHPRVEQRAGFLGELGVEVAASGEVAASPPFNQTSVAGCYAAGDAATGMRSVLQALQMGGLAGVGMVADLQHELDAKDEI